MRIMKNLLIVLFVFGISISSFAGLDVKQVVGSWKYTVETGEGDMAGVLKFVESEGKLTGKVITDDGNTFPMTKVEIKEGDILHFELKPEYDVIKVTVKVEDKKFKGSGATYEGEFALTGEKQK